MTPSATRRRVVVDQRELAQAIGSRIKQARLRAGLTQQALAGERYTKAYISALEHGIAKPSMAALNYLAERLGTSASALISDPDRAWLRVEADLHLAAGDWRSALDGYTALLDDTTDRVARAAILAGMAEALCRLDRPAEAIAPASEASHLFQAAGREDDAARVQYWLGSAQHQRDNPDEARSILRTLLDRVRGGLDLGADFEVRLLIGLGLIEAYRGENSAALAYLEEARDRTTELDARRRGSYLFSLAKGYRQAGDLEAAIRTGLQSLGLFKSAEADLDAAMVENNLALAYLAAGNTTRAGEMASRARGSAIARADERISAYFADTEAQVHLAGGNPGRALELADEAIKLAEANSLSTALLDANVTRARALLALSRHDEGIATFERAAAIARESAPPSRVRQVLSAWADALAEAGRPDEAYAIAREALAAR